MSSPPSSSSYPYSDLKKKTAYVHSSKGTPSGLQISTSDSSNQGSSRNSKNAPPGGSHGGSTRGHITGGTSVDSAGLERLGSDFHSLSMPDITENESCQKFLEGLLSTASPMHPLDFPNVALLRLEPEAEIVLTHDNDLCSSMPEDFADNSENLRIKDFLDNVAASCCAAVDQNGKGDEDEPLPVYDLRVEEAASTYGEKLENVRGDSCSRIENATAPSERTTPDDFLIPTTREIAQGPRFQALLVDAPEADISSHPQSLQVLKERYQCPHFRILIVGRANAGKTTILEKVCNVTPGTKPIVYDRKGRKIDSFFPKIITGAKSHLTPSTQRGEHDIEHQITYPGCNFIFHDSRGFEAGSQEEIKIVRKFLSERSAATDVKSRLHAIWYCIPMDDSRPIAPAELAFFQQSTGEVPVIVVFTKFDGRIIQEYSRLVEGNLDEEARWNQAKTNADDTLQRVYVPLVQNTPYPPKGVIPLEDMHNRQTQCPELTAKTAAVITDPSFRRLFISVQRNNINLCIRAAIEGVSNDVLKQRTSYSWVHITLSAMCYFPHCWETSWKYDHKQLKKIEHGDQNWLELWEEFHFQEQDLLKNFLPKLLQLIGLRKDAIRLEGNDITKTWQFLSAILIILEHSSWGTAGRKSLKESAALFIASNHAEKIKSHLSFVPGDQDLHMFLYNQVVSILMPAEWLSR